MNNQLVQNGFFDLEEVSSEAVQIPLDFEATVAQVKALIEEDNALGRQQEEIAARRYEIRVQIGFRLIALQQDHAKRGYGDFIAFAEKEFGYKSRSTVYEHINVAERLGHLNVRHGAHSNWSTARELARPSTSNTIIEQVLEGSIEATPEAIKQARKDEAEAKQRAKQLEEELEAEKREREINEQAHTTLVQSLEQKLEEKPEPVKVIEYQDTLETAAKVATLEQQIKALEDKPDIPPEKQQELDNLQQELTNAKTQLDFYTTQNEALAKEINEHREAVGRSLEDATALAGRLRIRQVWQYATDEIQAAIRKFHARVPSEIDRESFEGEENTRTAQTIDLLIETAMLLRKTLLSSDSTIDADIATTAIPHYQAAIPGPTISADYQDLFKHYQQHVRSQASDNLLWLAPDNGIMSMEMDKEGHITYTRELLKSGDPYRIRCAIEGMKRTLGTWED